jgi:MADS-box transcription factor
MAVDTPASALPSRFLNTDFLPSPSSFYPEWNFRGNDSNTLPSPLNFATPVAGFGPSFLREEPNHAANGNASGSAAQAASSNAGSNSHGAQATGAPKRKSPEYGTNGEADAHDAASDAKRAKVDN